MNGLLLTALATVTALNAGPLELELHSSTSAQLFHIVDQLSEWSIYCHPQYRRRLGPLSAAEEALLQKHAAIRKARGYGILDQVFYPAEDWRAAIDKAVKSAALSPSEADGERELLSRFEPRLMPFIAAGRPLIESAVARLRARAAELETFARKVARFTGQAELRLPVYLIPSGEKGISGGGANGGVLVVEVAEGGDPYFTLLHETWHAFVEQKADALDAAVKHTPGLDRTLLGEAMAYVIHPGLFHAGSGDQLLTQVRSDLAEMRTHSDERFRRYASFNRFALALRPLLAAALENPDETLLRFLPRACDVFRALESLRPALDGNQGGKL
jgi:hypothetical protein